MCRQFWTLEQILKFGELDYYNKLKLYNPLLDHLQIHAEQKLADDIQAKNVLIDLLEKVDFLRFEFFTWALNKLYFSELK